MRDLAAASRQTADATPHGVAHCSAERTPGTSSGCSRSLNDLLGARARILDAEHRRESVLGAPLRLPVMFGGRSNSAA
jgi:hypothetical protein